MQRPSNRVKLESEGLGQQGPEVGGEEKNRVWSRAEAKSDD
jgi:hypothetical protein